MSDPCYLVPGEFGIFIQIILGSISLCFLCTKYMLEKPRRPIRHFINNIISIFCASFLVHFINIFLCIGIFQYHLMIHLYNSTIDECSIYFLQTFIDASLGLYLEYKLFPILKFLKIRRDYLLHRDKSLIYKPLDAWDHFSEFIKLVQNQKTESTEDAIIIQDKSHNVNNGFFRNIWKVLNKYVRKNPYEPNWKTQRKNEMNHSSSPSNNDLLFVNNKEPEREQIQKEYFQGNADYIKKEMQTLNEKKLEEMFDLPCDDIIHDDYDDVVIMYEHRNVDYYKETYEEHTEENLIYSIFLWVSVVLTAKMLVALFFFLCFPILHLLELHTVSHIVNCRMKLFVVMIIIPFFFNMIVYFFTDNIIKSKRTYANKYSQKY